jgi:hypothetical protein
MKKGVMDWLMDLSNLKLKEAMARKSSELMNFAVNFEVNLHPDDMPDLVP